MAKRTCTIDGCERFRFGHGMCNGHYQRWYYRGDVRADVPLPELRHRATHASPADHFRYYMPEKPPRTGCWPWRGSVNSVSGYGTISHKGRKIRASHIAYELFIGPVSSNLIVRHTCDNPICVRPAHLLLGTQIDNIQDMVDRNRQWRGGGRKLTPDQVREIRHRYMIEKITWIALAEQYGVKIGAIQNIIRRRTWQNID